MEGHQPTSSADGLNTLLQAALGPDFAEDENTKPHPSDELQESSRARHVMNHSNHGGLISNGIPPGFVQSPNTTYLRREGSPSLTAQQQPDSQLKRKRSAQGGMSTKRGLGFESSNGHNNGNNSRDVALSYTNGNTAVVSHTYAAPPSDISSAQFDFAFGPSAQISFQPLDDYKNFPVGVAQYFEPTTQIPPSRAPQASLSYPNYQNQIPPQHPQQQQGRKAPELTRSNSATQMQPIGRLTVMPAQPGSTQPGATPTTSPIPFAALPPSPAQEHHTVVAYASGVPAAVGIGDVEMPLHQAQPPRLARAASSDQLISAEVKVVARTRFPDKSSSTTTSNNNSNNTTTTNNNTPTIEDNPHMLLITGQPLYLDRHPFILVGPKSITFTLLVPNDLISKTISIEVTVVVLRSHSEEKEREREKKLKGSTTVASSMPSYPQDQRYPPTMPSPSTIHHQPTTMELRNVVSTTSLNSRKGLGGQKASKRETKKKGGNSNKKGEEKGEKGMSSRSADGKPKVVAHAKNVAPYSTSASSPQSSSNNLRWDRQGRSLTVTMTASSSKMDIFCYTFWVREEGAPETAPVWTANSFPAVVYTHTTSQVQPALKSLLCYQYSKYSFVRREDILLCFRLLQDDESIMGAFLSYPIRSELPECPGSDVPNTLDWFLSSFEIIRMCKKVYEKGFIHGYLDRKNTWMLLKEKPQGTVILRLGTVGLVASISTADKPRRIEDICHVEITPASPKEIANVLSSPLCVNILRTDKAVVRKGEVLVQLEQRGSGGYVTVFELNEKMKSISISPTQQLQPQQPQHQPQQQQFSMEHESDSEEGEMGIDEEEEESEEELETGVKKRRTDQQQIIDDSMNTNQPLQDESP